MIDNSENRLEKTLKAWLEGQSSGQAQPQTVPRQLDDAALARLADKLLQLPVPLHNVLFMRHSFGLEDVEIMRVLDIAHPGQLATLAQELLKQVMGLDAPIAESSLRQACDMALERYTGQPVRSGEGGTNLELDALLANAAPKEPGRALSTEEKKGEKDG